MKEDEPTTVYTIGHSNHPWNKFLSLLKLHKIQTLADVRSRPTSRFHHFRQANLQQLLSDCSIQYQYFGNELGGHPEDDRFYDSRRRVIYERIAATRKFHRGIDQIIELSSTTLLVLLCAEGDPIKCHRHPLLARYLSEREIRVLHIQRDGSLQDAEPLFSQPVNSQIPLFEPPGEDLSWRSPKRIHERKRNENTNFTKIKDPSAF